ncbi:hypothetical protein PT7_2454 [Pusillimonas sp. T7-7]|nr:hypothetical protein [Pusillimonas sp. T7-7]AEC20994.1 hypothetical protein PT7_2454 [Pusillimonas sp. T7-7]
MAAFATYYRAPRAGKIHVELSDEQLQALVIGLAWHRIGEGGIIDVI